MLLKLIGLQIITFLIEHVDITSAKVPVYDNVCDFIIKIGETDQAARLMFRYNPSTGPHECNITIETLEGYQTNGGYHRIAYSFLDSGAESNFKCSSLILYDNGFSSSQYCGNNVYPTKTQITRDNRLLLSVSGDKETEFMFDMLFLSFHNGSCATFETRCTGLLGDLDAGSACIDYSLVCHETYHFCNKDNSQCSDITPTINGNSSVIAIIVVTLVAVLLVSVICFLCYKKNFFGLLKRRGSDSDVRAQAMNIFSLQLASRGVDGNDNTAATDDEGNPIDFSKFDPPPEYGSWEHLDTIGVNERTNENEVLPSYGDVMKNFDNYTVTTQI